MSDAQWQTYASNGVTYTTYSTYPSGAWIDYNTWMRATNLSDYIFDQSYSSKSERWDKLKERITVL